MYIITKYGKRQRRDAPADISNFPAQETLAPGLPLIPVPWRDKRNRLGDMEVDLIIGKNHQ